MTEDEKRDALDWLERSAAGDSDAPETAQLVVDLVVDYESRENTVLGMLTARRPYDEIRNYLLGDGS